ncbi:MAG: butyrate kinase [Clostridiales bacterium]|nr:butyrate kinase [Clostridiales bacterium]
MEKKYRVLAINPGSTSTKVGVYEGYDMLYEGTVRHSQEELSKFEAIHDQKDMRMQLVEELIEENGFKLSDMDAFVGRGGIVRPLKSGVYTINEKLMDDLKNLPSAQRHASMLGGVIARAFGDTYGKPSFIVDPVTVDERDEIAKITGLPQIKRDCIFHCLNQKSVCRYHCRLNGLKYEEQNFVVAHLGGGISVAAHRKGVICDVTDAITGEGPFTPERCGSIPAKLLADLIYDGGYSREEVYKLIAGKGGFMAHFNTNSAIEVEKMVDAGDEHAKLIYEAMGYNIAKCIGMMATVLSGKVDAVIITGGMAYSRMLSQYIKERVEFIAPVSIYPGEGELSALAAGAMRVLNGEEEPKEYLG